MEQNKVQKRKLLKSSKNKIERKNKRLKKLLAIVTMVNICAVGMINVSAETPAGVDTTTFNELLDIAYWVVIIVIAAGGGVASLMKISSGIANENPTEKNTGITGLIATGAIAGAAIAIKAILF